TYANAGHNPPYAIRDGLELLCGSEGIPLGIFAGEKYTDSQVKIENGDTVFLYTDGVSEAVNEAGEFYGVERLESVLKEEAAAGKRHFIEAVEASVRLFASHTEQNDDITMLCLYFREKPALSLGYNVREFGKIRDCIMSGDLPKALLMKLCVAAEECFVNICSYAFDGSAPEDEKILFDFEYSDKVVMRFSDGGRPFDPRYGLPDASEYDVDTAIGGLGRLIAFTIADSVDYEYKDGRNILTITKNLF
ncbi:MAG: SpoIIE family protein phosphatase, partial [Alistipes sp.]|nr:SpoIIE family protein phosphatase [Candidatus Minthomonas equi]